MTFTHHKNTHTLNLLDLLLKRTCYSDGPSRCFKARNCAWGVVSSVLIKPISPQNVRQWKITEEICLQPFAEKFSPLEGSQHPCSKHANERLTRQGKSTPAICVFRHFLAIKLLLMFSSRSIRGIQRCGGGTGFPSDLCIVLNRSELLECWLGVI